jgi:putative FmdB family regulatory protein
VPTYDYKCRSCKEAFLAIHSIKDKAKDCPTCGSVEIEKTISLFAAKTEVSLENMNRKFKEQAVKDIKRFNTDDKFAANLTGADDVNHQAKLNKVLEQQRKKNDEARKKIKRLPQ